jgi:hypothetical protein
MRGAYGAEIFPMYVVIAVSCAMGAFYFYKNRDR